MKLETFDSLFPQILGSSSLVDLWYSQIHVDNTSEYWLWSLSLLALGLVFWILLYRGLKRLITNFLCDYLFPETRKASTRSTTPSDSVMYQRKKFQTAFWKATSYIFLFLFGFFVLSHESWVMDYENYVMPLQQFSFSIAVYYQLTISYYLFSIYSLVYLEARLKDFYQMTFHHLVTLFLTIGSYYCLTCVRIGTVVMILHDVCDPFMELAKLFVYCQRKTLGNFFFLTFTVVFITSRDIIYPLFVIRPLFYVELAKEYKTGNLYIYALCIIQLLNLYWSYLIISMVMNSFGKGKDVEKDVRED